MQREVLNYCSTLPSDTSEFWDPPVKGQLWGQSPPQSPIMGVIPLPPQALRTCPQKIMAVEGPLLQRRKEKCCDGRGGCAASVFILCAVASSKCGDQKIVH